jgi:hypothetical protein
MNSPQACGKSDLKNADGTAFSFQRFLKARAGRPMINSEPDSQNRPRGLHSDVIEQRHKPEVHVDLLVAVKQRQARSSAVKSTSIS